MSTGTGHGPTQLRLALMALALAAFWPAPAHAELVFFGNGRTLSIKAHRLVGPSLVLMLRAGGEIECDQSLVASIEPDEVPWPEPPTVPEAPARAQAAPLDLTVRYAALINDAATRHGVDPQLVSAVIKVESNYEERARSRKGAMGLMQLMPDTARQYAVSDPYDPRSNIDAGVRHLKSLLARFSLQTALAAYNAGEGTVQRYGGIPPYQETRDYVARIVRLLNRPSA